MAYLQKAVTLFDRDEKGELLPLEVELETLPEKPTVRIKPLTRGKIKEIHAALKDGETTKDQDSDIIRACCVDPAYTEEEVKYLKPQIANALVTAIFALSLGVTQESMLQTAKGQAIAQWDIKKKTMS